MTNEESDKWFKKNQNVWSPYHDDKLKKYEYEYTDGHDRDGKFTKSSLWCKSYQTFLELIEACNSKEEWGRYRVPIKKEANGQLLMF